MHPHEMAFGSLDAVGPVVLTAIALVCIFVECGFLVGLLFPGDSLLFTAGIFFAQQHHWGQAWLFAGLAWAAGVGGGQCGYLFARRTGHKFVARRDGKILNRRNLERAQRLLDGWGFWAVTLARMVPWVRTVVPTIAGAARMNPVKFLLASMVSTAAWVGVFMTVGYFGTGLLDQVPWLKTAALAVAVGVVVTTTVIGIIQYRQDSRQPAEEEPVEEEPVDA